MTEFQIQININNYNESNRTVARKVKLEELEEFKEIIKAINLNLNVTTWNWFNRLPDTWNGEKYVDNNYIIGKHFEENFGVAVQVDMIKKFFRKFNLYGDRIDSIKLYKIEEVNL